MGEQTRVQKRILRGYSKLAFGGIADAVRLMVCEDPHTEDIQKMDLFNVAEIKRPKGGGMEIKFFDRLKALQCMEQMSGEEARGPGDFYRALEQSVQVFAPTEDGEE